MFEHVQGHPAQDKLAPPRMAVGPHDDQVRAIVRRPGEDQIPRADAVGTEVLRTGGDAVPG